MSADTSSPTLPPSEAFAVLGNPTRMGILEALGSAGEPLAFSALRERVGTGDSGQFNYHLGKLEGHFVERTDEGYALRQAGRRVVEAVLSGAITEDPVIEPTRIDFDCRLCGSPIEVSFTQERVELYCTACEGIYDAGVSVTGREGHGYLGSMLLPPAGVKGRTPEEVFRAASTWAHLTLFADASGLCPRCSAPVEHAVDVCEDHDASGGSCSACGSRHAVQVHSQCTNCIYESRGIFGNLLLSDRELLGFVIDHGLNPLIDGIEWGWDYEETVHDIDPFRASFTHTLDGESITMTVDDSLNVVETLRHRDR